MSWLRTRLTFSNVMSVTAVFVALGGGAIAATSIIGKDGKVRACYAKDDGAVRLVAKGKKCKRGEKAASWNQKGQKGAKGETGAQGAAGANGSNGADGANGTNGADGAAGAPGSIIVAKLRGTLANLAIGGTNVPIPLTPTGWSQAAGELQFITGTIKIGSQTGCDQGMGKVVNFDVNFDAFNAVTTSAVTTTTKPMSLATSGNSSTISPLFEPASASNHTATVDVTNACDNAITNLEVAIDVVGVR